MANGISRLNDCLHQDAVRMRSMSNHDKHKPYDNTICEILAMINGATAAYSNTSNIAGFPISKIKIIKNIDIDKAIPFVVNKMNNMLGKKQIC